MVEPLQRMNFFPHICMEIIQITHWYTIIKSRRGREDVWSFTGVHEKFISNYIGGGTFKYT